MSDGHSGKATSILRHFDVVQRVDYYTFILRKLFPITQTTVDALVMAWGASRTGGASGHGSGRSAVNTHRTKFSMLLGHFP